MVKRYLLLLFFLILAPLFSQDSKINPVIPKGNSDLIYIEAEDGLVTNFATTPTLNYSASGQRTIQLSTYNSNFGGNPYFIEFEIYTQEDGEYSFWYGGTPPGTREELYPSYSSPFTLTVNSESSKLYREDVDVVEKYAPGLYWISTNKTFNLKKGFHHIKIEVDEKRGFDGKFYLFLDSIFLFKGDSNEPGIVPPLFPDNLNDRSIDNPFNTISFYQNRIKQNPEDVTNYLSLANIYIIIGDYFNSIKMLSRILQIDPKNNEANLLMAKSRIWNGDVDIGLKAYERYLNMYPENISVWGEAGKISAWVSKYDLSLSFYERGLSYFPDDISLKVNMGFTYLWKGDIDKGLDLLKEVESSLSTPDTILETLDSYYINGYPDYAIELNKKGIIKYPDALKLYLYLDRLYYSQGLIDESKSVIMSIKEKFIQTDELLNLLDINNSNKKIKELYINNLESIVSLTPTDLDTRELLVQTYFWNGLTEKSILEYKKIITIKHLDEMEKLISGTEQLVSIKNRLIYIKQEINSIREKKDTITREYYNGILNYRTATINNTEGDLSLIEAEENLKSTIGNLDKVTLYEELLSQEYRKLLVEINSANVENREKNDFFNNITSGNSWSYDKSLITDDLEELFKLGFNESSYLKTLLNLYDNTITPQDPDISKLSLENISHKKIIYLSKLWSGERDRDILRELEIYYPFFSREKDLIERVEGLSPESVEITKVLLDNYRERLFKADKSYQSLGDLHREVNNSKGIIDGIIYDNLVRSIYNFQEYTYQLRYTIGDYYLETEKYNKALRQYEHVISIDPLNISANFKLGRVRQLTGDWSSAMESYNKVFEVDPSFESAATMYNNLSRNHPETTSLTISYLTDSNLMHYKEDLNSIFNISSILSLSPKWTNNTLNYYKWSDYGPPLDFRLDDLGLEGSLSLLNNKLKLRPYLGSSIYNNKFSYITPIERDDFYSTLESIEYYPVISLGGSYQLNEYSIGSNLGFRQVIESFPRERIDIYSTYWDISLSGYYNLEGNTLNSLSFRSYFKMDSKEDSIRENLVGTALQDIILGLIINRNQWTILNIYSTTSYEFSTNNDVNEYYTPNSVFVSKLGGVLATWFPLSGGVSGLSFRAGGGIYIDKLGVENNISFATDGDLELNYNLEDKTLFIKIYGSGSFNDFSQPDYWSIQSTIGIKIDSYKLLAL